ncbi:helix-turn-helix transcriptional regulator [Balneatrix alpica]|uniref:helix-turn-helix transcriptional regulator n=1 Tax=Balneatrix alpica TaxID=75684 RepID=UPI0027385234|nr:AraC family transcriptional regulator [Balneatrix alpica]
MAIEAGVLASWLGVVSQGMSLCGVEPGRLLEYRGLEQQGLVPKGFNWGGGHERVSQRLLSQMLVKGRQLSQREDFILVVAKQVRPPSWYALGFAIWASSSLLQALELLRDYVRVFADAYQVELQLEQDQLRLQIGGVPGLADALTELDWQLLAATIALTVRHLHPQRLRPTQAALPGQPPSTESVKQSWQRVMGSQLLWQSAQGVELVYPLTALQQPLSGADPQLQRIHLNLLQAYLAQLDTQYWGKRLYLALLQQSQWPRNLQAQVAPLLGTSRRTLQRRLQQEGLSFQQIADQARYALACRYLQEARLSMGEISYQLGFANTANFYRAFRRWSGLAPGAYQSLRQRIQG